MNAKIEKTENNRTNFPNSEKDLSQTSNKDINIIIPKEESNKTSKKIKEVKNSKPKTLNNNSQEINKENNLELKNKILKAHKRLDIQGITL